MPYTVKEIFYTLQGEGANAGHPAVFCRFTGCNLWSGRELDRATAVCKFCDTDFVGGEKFHFAAALAARVRDHWPTTGRGFVVLTGGEPALQMDAELVTELHALNLRIAIETNGTIELTGTPDWITVSPKAGTTLRLRCADELKLVVPQKGIDPSDLLNFPATHRFLQPMDGVEYQENLTWATQYALENPEWRLSLQTHKLLGIR